MGITIGRNWSLTSHRERTVNAQPAFLSIILVVIFLFGGFGFYGRGRGSKLTPRRFVNQPSFLKNFPVLANSAVLTKSGQAAAVCAM
jgi:hypothetical protein